METQVANKVKAFPIYMSNSGCDFHRVRLPFIYGYEWYDHSYITEVHIEKLMEYYEQSDVIVANRVFPLGMDRLRQLKRLGVKFVLDLDDYWELPPHHVNYRDYKNKYGKLIVEFLKEADLVTVTTNRLYQKVAPYNDNVHVIPNALPFGQGQFRPHPSPPPREDDRFRFVYAGNSTHLEDVRLLGPVISRINQIDGIGFSMAGYKPNNAVWQKMEGIFSRMPGYKRIENLPLDSYMKLYDGTDCSIVPLLRNEFNRHKSNLKILEAAAKKIPVIVSDVPPYNDDDPPGVCWVQDDRDWIDHIKWLSQNRNAAKEMGEELHEWAVENFNLAYWNKVRFQLYESLR